MPDKRGSNDLNLLLKAKVVQLQWELDTSKKAIDKAKRQIDEIGNRLKDKPVKLDVKLDYSIKELIKEFTIITTRAVQIMAIPSLSVPYLPYIKRSSLCLNFIFLSYSKR